MSLRDYQYILTVAQTRHFGQAAKICHVSQPTLSMQIKKCEERFGISIFERNNKNVCITRDGKKLLNHIEAVLNAQRSLEDEIKTLQNPKNRSYIIGAFPTLAPFLLPRILPLITRQFPENKLYLIEERSAGLLDRLDRHELDAAFLAAPFEHQEKYQSEPIFSEPFFVALPRDHPLSHRKDVHLHELGNEKLLLLEESHCLTGQAVDACEWHGLKPSHDFRATSIETLRQMVASGLGITLMPKIAITGQNKDIIYLPLADTPRPGRDIRLVWRKNYAHGDFMKQISQIIQKHLIIHK